MIKQTKEIEKIEKIVLMWYKTHYGYVKEVQEATRDFADYMLKLYEQIKQEK